MSGAPRPHYGLVWSRGRSHDPGVARILIIDDDEPFRDLVREIVLASGHTVITASNGMDALKSVRADPVDLVLTDLMMPYGGLATIQILRTEFPQLGIIAMTGGVEHRLDYARSLGAHRTLTKPFSAAQLTAALDEVLSAHPPPKPGA